VFSTARVGAESVTDKYGRSLPCPALFDNKGLVLPSSCDLHPKYQALRPPRSEMKPGCTCAEIYSAKEKTFGSQ
jgi:hypothetical protein